MGAKLYCSEKMTPKVNSNSQQQINQWSPLKLLELTNELSKVTGYKIKQKSTVFLYTCNIQHKIKENSSYTSIKKNKIL